MYKLLVLAGIIAAVLATPVAAAAPKQKMSYGACRTKVMQDSRNLRGGTFCDRACGAAIRRCMHGG